jgi:hypothetical protein
VIGYVIEALGYDLNAIRTEVDVSSLDDSQLLNELGARLAARRKGQDLAWPGRVDLEYVTPEGRHGFVEIKDTSAQVHHLRDPVKELERLDRESHGQCDPQPPTAEELSDLTGAAAKRHKPKPGG